MADGEHMRIEKTDMHEIEASMRAQRPDTTRSNSNQEGAEELASITLTSLPLSPQASHPVSPGSSSVVPLQDDIPRGADFTPPARPSSTPFLHPERRESVCCSENTQEEGLVDYTHTMGTLGDDDSENNFSEVTVPTAPSPSLSGYEMEAPQSAVNLDSLPAEIHESILDHLFGERVSSASGVMGMHTVSTGWSSALRHSRRKELSQLALVSPIWRDLIQQRLYRHIKIQATVESIEQAVMFFSRHPHLQDYVKHMELWFPVFQRGPVTPTVGHVHPSQADDGLSAVGPVTQTTYTLPKGKCTLEEAFGFVKTVLPSVRVMTLEGGERRKAPKVLHFRDPASRALPMIASVQTLVVKGQWNVMRESEDFGAVLAALPNLVEWHGSYSRPKSKAYLSMAKVLPSLPLNITRLNLCLEGEYRREIACPPFFRKVTDEVHFCTALAAAVPTLEQFSYTGRLCRTFFDSLAQRVDPRTTRLRSINITARNVCRTFGSESGCGIQDLGFMRAFEQLVLGGIRALPTLQALEYLRVRYIDLDSPVPPLNPFFLMKDGYVTGLWSDTILSELERCRPSLKYDSVCEEFGEISVNKDGRVVINPYYPVLRVLSMKLSNYAYLSEGITMQH